MPKRSVIDNDRADAEVPVTSQKKMKRSVGERATLVNMSAVAAVLEERIKHEECMDSSEPVRDEFVAAPTTGVILRSGRIRLPDKLIQYLNNEVASESLFWQPDGQGFSIDCDKVQKDLLDRHFHGTKLSSFLRSLNRWGFKRLFYHSMPKNVLSFHHPMFRKDSPDLSKEMNMAPCAMGGAMESGSKKKAKGTSPDEAAQGTALHMSAHVPVETLSANVAGIIPAAVASSAAVSDPAPAQNNTTENFNTATGLDGLLSQLKAQMAVESAAKDLLLQQALQAVSQQQQELQQQQSVDAASLFSQVLSQSTTGSSNIHPNPIALLQSTTNSNFNNNALLQRLLSTLMGTAQPQVAPLHQQVQLPVQQPSQLQLQVPSHQLPLNLQQVRLPQMATNQVAPSQLASLASVLASGAFNFGSAAPVPQPQQSQADILQALSPQQQLAFLSLVSSSSCATNPN